MPDDTGRVTVSSEQRTETETERVDRPARDRRRLLAAGGGLAATLLAGCSGIMSGRGDQADGNATGNGTDTTTVTETRGTPPAQTDVVGLQYKQDDSTYEFIVTLDPPGDTDGADWWQVETLGGTKIDRKEFTEPKAGSRFTTTKDIEIGTDTKAVVVRGHDATSGYGGQVMLADLEEGFITLEKQGPEPSSFENYTF